jgi:DNA-binding NarL/FixJ family response regulator
MHEDADMPKKILVVDDFPIFREGLKALLSHVANLEVIGEAENGEIAVIKSNLLRPDLILMDLVMPVINGIDATRSIKQLNSDIKVLALTEQKSNDQLMTTMAAGADGYILKQDTTTSLLTAIDCVLNGDVYLSSGVDDKVGSGSQANAERTNNRSLWLKSTSRGRNYLSKSDKKT